MRVPIVQPTQICENCCKRQAFGLYCEDCKKLLFDSRKKVINSESLILPKDFESVYRNMIESCYFNRENWCFMDYNTFCNKANLHPQSLETDNQFIGRLNEALGDYGVISLADKSKTKVYVRVTKVNDKLYWGLYKSNGSLFF